jgi:DNA-binding response OmpR family regulator
MSLKPRATRKAATVFLLVEDDSNDVLFIQQEFKRSPRCRLQVVSDGIEARRYLEGVPDYEDRTKYPLPDLILLDLKMPRFSGFDFLEWLRYRSSGHLKIIPVVVLSSSDLRQDVLRAYALGVSSYLVKPVNWAEFRDRMRALAVYWAIHVETPAFSATVASLPAATAARLEAP